VDIVMHFKSVKHACKYALKSALKTPKCALKTHKTPTTNIKPIKNKSIVLQKVKLIYKLYMPKRLFQTC